jgi:hypothetical protein
MTRAPTTIGKRDQWRAAFPMNEAQRAARFLKVTWEDLVTSKPRGFNRKLRENQLTEKLHSYLVRLAKNDGLLTGFWINEDVDTDMDYPDSDNPTVIKRIRKDITYMSNVSGTRMTLIFEFKKVTSSGDSWRQYRGENGMRRFVDGIYARGQPLALMVGMLMDSEPACIQGLRASLQSPGSRQDLRMVQIANEWLCTPSTAFPGLADFDTEHNRPVREAPAHGTMLLSHLFISMPI